jgi:hypothetical protein
MARIEVLNEVMAKLMFGRSNVGDITIERVTADKSRGRLVVVVSAPGLPEVKDGDTIPWARPLFTTAKVVSSEWDAPIVDD